MKSLVPLFLLIPFFLSTIYISQNIFEAIPHSQDEVAYLFQAKIFSSGHLYLPSLPDPLRRFFDHEFIVNNGKWYGKYPPGHSLLLALGLPLHLEFLITPIFSTLSLGLIFALTKQLFNFKTAFLSTILLATSPFYLLISSTYLSHPTALFFTVLFLYSLIRKNYLLVGLSLGAVFLIRPYNTLPLLTLLIFPLSNLRYLRYLSFFLPFILLASLGLLYNYLLTGSPFLLPQNVYSSFDKPGFGSRGVEWGSDFTPQIAVSNLLENLNALKEFLLPQPLSFLLLFIPFAFFKKPSSSSSLSFYFLLNIISYFFYFHPGTFLGPRYYFESAWVLIILSVFGFTSLLSLLNFNTLILITSIVIIMILSISFDINFLPSFRGYNGMTKVDTSKFPKNSLVFIPGQKNWQAYGKYFYLLSPKLSENSIIFARDMAVHNVPKNLPPLDNNLLINYLPNRQIFVLH